MRPTIDLRSERCAPPLAQADLLSSGLASLLAQADLQCLERQEQFETHDEKPLSSSLSGNKPETQNTFPVRISGVMTTTQCE